ncbi:MAG: VCBS repeat-containing protein [Oligoflexia bacterium]|nr:VCBS repeat-containing protein [Oligoflexia bacterium]
MKLAIGILGCLLAAILSGCSATHYEGPVFSHPTTLGEGKEWRNYPVVEDLDGDGRLDLVATHRRPLHENSMHIWLGGGDGQFQELPQTWHSPGYSGVGAGDLNGDGQIDLVAGSHFNRIHTYLSRDLGMFTESVMPSPDGYVNANIKDLNGDGIPEIIMLGNERAGIEIFEPGGDQGIIPKSHMLEGNIGRDIRIVDMNKDGLPDIVASFGRIGVMVLLQTAAGTWTAVPAEGLKSETSEFRSLDVGDVNNDGWPDLALNGGFAGLFKPNGPDVYLSNGEKGGWSPALTGLKHFKRPAEGVALADFDGDGNLDLIAGGNPSEDTNNKAYGLFLFRGDGRGHWELIEDSGLPKSGLPRPYGIVARDLNGDSHPDLVVAHGAPEEGDGFVRVWLNAAPKVKR